MRPSQCSQDRCAWETSRYLPAMNGVGPKDTWTLVASKDALNYFHSHTKPKRIQPFTHFIHILCNDYGLLWIVNKVFTVYKSWKIAFSFSSRSTFLACSRADWVTVSSSSPIPQGLRIYRTPWKIFCDLPKILCRRGYWMLLLQYKWRSVYIAMRVFCNTAL